MTTVLARGKGVTIGSSGQGQNVAIIFEHLVHGWSYIETHQGDSNPSQVLSQVICYSLLRN